MIYSEECIGIWPYNRKMADGFGDPLCTCGETGEICFSICGDVYPRECEPDMPYCGDGVVNVFDILEEIDFVLGIGDPSECVRQRGQMYLPAHHLIVQSLMVQSIYLIPWSLLIWHWVRLIVVITIISMRFINNRKHLDDQKM